jgi:nicotinamidase-related amidase
MPSSGIFSGTMSSGSMSGTIPVEADYAEIARRPLEAEQCALIVVDMQEKLLPTIWEKERLVRNVQLLTRLAGILKIPAIVTTQYAKGLGNTVPDIASMLPDTPPIDKLMFSCFGSDVFCSLLKRLPGQRTTILLCGMETHICVMQTALGALRDGYLVHVAADAVSSRTELNWRIGLDRMRAAGAIISSTEMMIYELLRSSGAPAFREMLPHLKA